MGRHSGAPSPSYETYQQPHERQYESEGERQHRAQHAQPHEPQGYPAGYPEQSGYAAYAPDPAPAPAPYGYDALGSAEHGYARDSGEYRVPPQQHDNTGYGTGYGSGAEQPYWADPVAYEAPMDPAPSIPHQYGPGAAQPQHRQAYGQPYEQPYDRAYDQAGDQALGRHGQGRAYPPAPEPEFDPEPAAWDEAVYVEPVDDLPYESRAASGGYDSSGYESTSYESTNYESRGYESSGYVPDGPRPASRAASRRAARAAARKPRRPLMAAGGVVATGAVLAGVVAVQMPDGGSQAQANSEQTHTDEPSRNTDDVASRDNDRGQVQAAVPPQATPNAPGPSTLPIPTPSAPLSLTERMKVRFDLDAKLSLPGKFDTVPGKAGKPGTSGKTYTYRVEIEQGLGLDGGLFADAVQQTLNDPRSWAHEGKTFVRTDAGSADFVIRLASPGTTHRLCAAAGLDTSIQNVSCDAAGAPWVVINAWRWAQGSPTFGDEMVGYREMLINHEVGHRLGLSHETAACLPNGLAPVMMQQTKSLDADNGSVCRPNAWPYPS